MRRSSTPNPFAERRDPERAIDGMSREILYAEVKTVRAAYESSIRDFDTALNLSSYRSPRRTDAPCAS
jgi:hypothetical protein